MAKELVLAKKLAMLGWLYREGFITESEYAITKNRIMREYGIISFMAA